jgi:hypothetical protein
MLGFRILLTKVVLPLLAIFYLTGCSTTKGISDSSLESTKPYLFEYKGSVENAIIEIKRMVVRNGFTILNDDVKAGILTTNPKLLEKDERFYSTSPFIPFSQNENGKLFFVITQASNDKVKIEFYAKLISVEKISEFISDGGLHDSKTRKEESVEQGHPLAMKYRKLLEEIGMKWI